MRPPSKLLLCACVGPACRLTVHGCVCRAVNLRHYPHLLNLFACPWFGCTPALEAEVTARRSTPLFSVDAGVNQTLGVRRLTNVPDKFMVVRAWGAPSCAVQPVTPC